VLPVLRNAGSQSTTCSHTLDSHICEKDVAAIEAEQGDEFAAAPRWRTGTLHNGKLDVEGTLWTLASRAAPLVVLKDKLAKYIEEGQLDESRYDEYVEVFEQMQGAIRQQSIFADPAAASAFATEEANRPMSDAEPQAELASREKLMQTLHEQEGAWTDQWRVYTEIVEARTSNSVPLRLFL
jgi:hypothetical protein